jgi:hypothetical protein
MQHDLKLARFHRHIFNLSVDQFRTKQNRVRDLTRRMPRLRGQSCEKIAMVVRHLGHILCCGRMVRVERVHCIRVLRGVQKKPNVGSHGAIGFDHT